MARSRTCQCTGGSFAESARAGYRMPELKVLSTPQGSGPWSAVANHDVAATVPGASQDEQEVAMTTRNGNVVLVSQVETNCHALLKVSAWKFGGLSGKADAATEREDSAMRYAEPFAAEYAFRRNGPRLSRRRPRASPFGSDNHSNLGDCDWVLVRAAQRRYAPDSLAVAEYVLAGGAVTWEALFVPGTVSRTSTQPGCSRPPSF